MKRTVSHGVRTRKGVQLRLPTRHRGYLITLVCSSFICSTHAAPIAAQSELPITIAAGTHALTVPWYPGPMTDRMNPAVLVGTDRTWRSGDRWRLYFGINLGFFRHHWWMTGVSIEPELGIGRSLPGGFHADLRLGLGYMHYFWRRERMELNHGRWTEAADLGRPSLIVPLSATLGYRGNEDDPPSIAPFFTARWGVQGLFLEEAPAMTHLQFLGGVRIVPKQHTTIEGG